MTRQELLRVLLVGFMGSGKTSVGRDLAVRLNWRFVDFDEAIEIKEGRSVADIFAVEGEPYFRKIEERVAENLLSENRIVLASGGGWAIAPGRLAAVSKGTATFWLRVSAEKALERASREPGRRPLLEQRDALDETRELLIKRVPHYQTAQWAVDTEHSPVEDVSVQILEILTEKYTRAVGE